MTRSDPLPAPVELCADGEVDAGGAVEVDVELVCVTVIVAVLWGVPCDAPPGLVPMPRSVTGAINGDGRTWAPPIEGEDAPPLKACVATTTEPVAASTTRVSTETTDNF